MEKFYRLTFTNDVKMSQLPFLTAKRGWKSYVLGVVLAESLSLGNEKKNGLFFCISLAYSYLCAVNNETVWKKLGDGSGVTIRLRLQCFGRLVSKVL